MALITLTLGWVCDLFSAIGRDDRQVAVRMARLRPEIVQKHCSAQQLVTLRAWAEDVDGQA